VVQQVLPYTVHNEVQKFVLFVEEQRHGQVTDLLFGVLVRRYEVDSFEVAKVDVPSQNINVQELLAILA
jgi:hypothetical protein